MDALVKRGTLLRETRRVLSLLPYHRHLPGPDGLSARIRGRTTGGGDGGGGD